MSEKADSFKFVIFCILIIQFYSSSLLELYETMQMHKESSFHDLKKFADTKLCHPLNCNLTTLFWYIMKTTGTIGIKEANIILEFLHSPYFKLEDTPKSYSELESFESKLKKGNVISCDIALHY